MTGDVAQGLLILFVIEYGGPILLFVGVLVVLRLAFGRK